MNDLIIKCPKCKADVKVTEVIAAPLIESRLSNLEREIRAEEAKKTIDLETKLINAQKEQAEAVRLKREIVEKERELDLTIERQVTSRLSDMRIKIQQEAEKDIELKITERDHLIESLQSQISTLKQKAEQGSQQLQGEAQELHLESLLIERFPFDKIVPVPKGIHGGDITQSVFTKTGLACGTILWESKRTRTWSDSWLPKLRDDQRAAKADLAVIVSVVLPKDVMGFDLIEGVWVVGVDLAYSIACVLRQSLIEISTIRQSLEGQDTKAGLLYKYLTGSKFKLRMQAFIETFSIMKGDLDKERRVIQKQWAKREEQLDQAIGSLVGIHGELQGIAGTAINELENLDLKALEG